MPTSEEMEEIEFNIKHIDNAIQKSVADDEYTIFRGIRSIARIENPFVGGIFTEKAFGSFTLSFDKALGYTSPEGPIIFQLELSKGENVFFMDHGEKEMLRPRNSTYEITKIETEHVDKFNSVGKIYYIEILEG